MRETTRIFRVVSLIFMEVNENKKNK